MKICILQTGSTPESLKKQFKSYPEMIIELISDFNKKISFEIFNCSNNYFPKETDFFDGYIITGSAFGVYDEEEWITKLLIKIRDIYKKNIPLVGICFGHQAIAEALGGKVIKSTKGWGVGIKQMKFNVNKPWINPPIINLKLIYSHQDQVIKLPKNSQILSGDDFCPISSFSIKNKVFTLQGHPEFKNDFALKLLDLRKNKIDINQYNIAKKSLIENEHDGRKIGKWIFNFLKQ